MYIGIGILAASLSFVAYHRFYSSGTSYQHPLDFLKHALCVRFDSQPTLNKVSSAKEREGNDKDNGAASAHGGQPFERHSTTSKPKEGSTTTASSSSSIQESRSNSPLPSIALTPHDQEDDVGAPLQLTRDISSTMESVNIVVSETPSTPQEETQNPPSPPPSRPRTPTLHPSTSMPPPARPTSSTKRKTLPNSRTVIPSTNNNQKPHNNLMPPPLRPGPRSHLSASSPRQPRLPPSNSSLSTSTLPPPSRPSRKVLLDPGHSPLDWAHLVTHPPTPTFLRGTSVPERLIRVPPSLLRLHNGRKGHDAWGVWQGKVYNLSPYLKFHPGGVGEILRAAGKETEGERLFMEVHPWVSWEGMLSECMVGILVGEGERIARGQGDEGGDLEAMD